MKKHILPILLVTCTLVVAFWQIMARWSAQPFRPFDLTASDLSGFRPDLPGWEVQVLPVATNDPVEPNILALQAIRSEPALLAAPVTVLLRLVHGYNMPMCMKIKGYTVAAIGDLRQAGGGKRDAAGGKGGEASAKRPEGTGQWEEKQGVQERTEDSLGAGRPHDGSTRQAPSRFPLPAFPAQLWRVTGSSGEASIWVTTMVRAGDFEPTDLDICSMAFPRVDIADDPHWVPRGFAWSDLRHPLNSVRRWVRGRWNASRTDMLTFLRLRQPTWASEEMLSFVTHSIAPVVAPEEEGPLIEELVQVHLGALGELREWRKQH